MDINKIIIKNQAIFFKSISNINKTHNNEEKTQN